MVVDPKVAEAVRARTPIVVMWSTPVSDGASANPSPWKITIVEANGDPVNTDTIEPLWIEWSARVLAQFDQRLARRDVAAIAVFPREAFVLGRVVFLYAKYPPDYERHVARSIRRSARIDWDGTRPDFRSAREPRF